MSIKVKQEEKSKISEDGEVEDTKPDLNGQLSDLLNFMAHSPNANDENNDESQNQNELSIKSESNNKNSKRGNSLKPQASMSSQNLNGSNSKVSKKENYSSTLTLPSALPLPPIIKESQSSSDSSNSDDDSDIEYVTTSKNETRCNKVIANISIDSDSESNKDEEDNNEINEDSNIINNQTPEKEAINIKTEELGSSEDVPITNTPSTISMSLRTRKRAVIYKEESDDDEPEIKKAKENNLKKIKDISSFLKVVKKKKEEDLIDYLDAIKIFYLENIFYNQDEDVAEFYGICGKYIKRLSISFWFWQIPQNNKKDAKNLANILKICKNLESLELRQSFSESLISDKQLNSHSFELNLNLPKLKELEISNTSRNIFIPLKFILTNAPNLEIFKFTFKETIKNYHKSIDRILEVIANTSLSLKTILIQPQKEVSYIKSQQIAKLANANLSRLENLELGLGLWEDVKSSQLENLFAKFSKTIKSISIRGSYMGSSSDLYFTIKLPKMPNLTYFSFGGSYEFLPDIEILNHRKTNYIELDSIKEKTELFPFSIYFPKMENLKSLILGNLIDITTLEPKETPDEPQVTESNKSLNKTGELHFGNFPSLKVFRVASGWNKIISFPSQNSKKRKYPNDLEEFQFPDLLKDCWLVQKISEEFSNIKKVWLYLPSISVLREFLLCFSKLKIEELYLKTRCDFQSMMEPVLLGRSDYDTFNISYYDKHTIGLLKKYKHCKDFMQYHNIEFPLENDPNDTRTFKGIGDLKHLKVLEMEHIARTLRIPKGEKRWYDINCNFNAETIGLQRPALTRSCFVEELPKLEGLQKITYPGFFVDGEDWNDFQDNSGFQSLIGCELDKTMIKIRSSLLSKLGDFKQKEEK